MSEIEKSKASKDNQKEIDQIDRWWSRILIELCKAAEVDPATLEDGPEALHDSIVKMVAEVKHLREQRDWLQASNTELLTRARNAESHARWMGEECGTNRRADVVQFFNAIGDGHHVGATPHVPPVESLRLALLLIVEEVGETLLSCFSDWSPDTVGGDILQALETIKETLQEAGTDEFEVRLPDLADGVIDSFYVLEGLLVRCGINGAPIWNLVHAANMTKAGGPRDPVTGKQRKPEWFQPPDVAGELKRQGWEP